MLKRVRQYFAHHCERSINTHTHGYIHTIIFKCAHIHAHTTTIRARTSSRLLHTDCSIRVSVTSSTISAGMLSDSGDTYRKRIPAPEYCFSRRTKECTVRLTHRISQHFQRHNKLHGGINTFIHSIYDAWSDAAIAEKNNKISPVLQITDHSDSHRRMCCITMFYWFYWSYRTKLALDGVQVQQSLRWMLTYTVS